MHGPQDSKTLAAALLLLLGAAASPLLPAQGTIVVEGRVCVKERRSGRLHPVNAATVRILPPDFGSPYDARTGYDGRYRITMQRKLPGNYVIMVRTDRIPISHEFGGSSHVVTLQESYNQPVVRLDYGVNSGIDVFLPQPVLFVHGLLGGRDTWQYASSRLAISWPWTSPPRRGYMTALLTYYGPLGIAQTMPEKVEMLEREIAAVRFGLGRYHNLREVPVDLVAHSEGGLVARAYLASKAGYGDVDRLYTFGTPHGGASVLMHLPTSIYQFIRDRYEETLRSNAPRTDQLTKLCFAAWQLHPQYIYDYYNPNYLYPSPALAGTRLVLVGSSSSHGFKWWLNGRTYDLPHPLFKLSGTDHRDDGWVSNESSIHYAWSAYGGMIDRGGQVEEVWLSGAEHTQLHSDPETLETIIIKSLEK